MLTTCTSTSCIPKSSSRKPTTIACLPICGAQKQRTRSATPEPVVPPMIKQSSRKRIPHVDPSASPILDTRQINAAIQTFLYNKLCTVDPSAQPPTSSLPARTVETLSVNNRGTTVAGWNASMRQRTVVRISCWDSSDESFVLAQLRNGKTHRISGLGQSSYRIWLFGQKFLAGSSHARGIVPIVSTPAVIGDGNFLVEQYEEIVYEKGRRMDLFTFSLGRRLVDKLECLYDAIVGVATMHASGWAHLDVSLENIVISKNHGFIIDFESVLPFGTLKGGLLKRKHLQVTMKIPYVPPENYISRGDDMISLPTYDVWAFGVCIFSILFDEYFFPMIQYVHENGQKQLHVDERCLGYFTRHGFKKYVKKYHHEAYRTLFHKPSPFYRSAANLLGHIFVPASRVRVADPRKRTMKSKNGYHDLSQREARPEVSCWSDRRRLTMEELMHHKFWSLLERKRRK